MKKLLCIFLALLIGASLCVTASAGADVDERLSFGTDGKFTVLQISDPQDDQYPAYDLVKFLELSIEQTQPDLIVFTGDIVEDSRIGDPGVDAQGWREGVTVEDLSGNIDYAATLKNVETACATVFAVAEEKNIPFAVSQGNNDYNSGIKNEDWLRIYGGYKNCIVKDESPDAEGRIDFNIEIKGNDGKTALNIWIMDTKTSAVTSEQIEWYKSESAALKAANGGTSVPAILFQHINTDDIGNLFEKCNFWDEGASIDGTECYRLNQSLASGYSAGFVKPGQTSEQFAAWKECGDVMGAYFGHWHSEGYTGTWDGIELGFTYGCEFAKQGPYGVRVFTFDEEDVRNFNNDLYTYEGSVRTNNARLELQVDEPYKEYDNLFEEAFAAVRNIFTLIKKEISNLLS